MKHALDIRQTDEWGKYLASMGWKQFRTARGIGVVVKKMFFGSVIKVQRPQDVVLQDLRDIDEICVKNKGLFIKFEPDFKQDLSIFKTAGYEFSYSPLCPPTTIYIDLTKSEEELWAAVSHSGKYSINRARREGAHVKFFPRPYTEILKKYHAVNVETGKLKKFYVQPFKEQLAKVAAFGDNCVLAAVYDADENMVGGKIFLGGGDMVLYNTGGTTAKGRHQKSGYLLVWETFLYFKKLGYSVMDLEGKDDKRFPLFTGNWGGFSHFKEKFNGETVEFPIPYIKFLSPVMEIMAKATPMGLQFLPITLYPIAFDQLGFGLYNQPIQD